uniref:AlNc14C14G1618 protein n=1 Tax=Albugo laibachii Nc14 TaxID=890382 RepID=F0W3V2_9STRA|nr:AlNc14C14G1618 [Albugo laibachii Nc14]|eukprot:CCA15701.1 AlNc14C14G1618 [Albugo laibachii Nc14]
MAEADAEADAESPKEKNNNVNHTDTVWRDAALGTADICDSPADSERRGDDTKMPKAFEMSKRYRVTLGLSDIVQALPNTMLKNCHLINPGRLNDTLEVEYI